MMNAENIAKADILDIVFDGRNKAYGAYDLRKTYQKRLRNSVLFIFSLTAAGFVSAAIYGNVKPAQLAKLEVKDVVLEDFKEEKKPDVPPPPPPPRVAEPPRLETVKLTPPLIVEDNQVKDDEKPPEVDKLETARIGLMNQDGLKDDGAVMPPIEKGTGGDLVVAPKVEEEDYEKTFTKVENPAEYPGGLDAWKRYLERTLQYPEPAVENGTQGVVRVQFVVDKLGNISEVKALNNPGDGLAEEAERIIKRGGKWKPAEQNGRKVIYRHIQNITFRLQ